MNIGKVKATTASLIGDRNYMDYSCGLSGVDRLQTEMGSSSVRWIESGATALRCHMEARYSSLQQVGYQIVYHINRILVHHAI